MPAGRYEPISPALRAPCAADPHHGLVPSAARFLRPLVAAALPTLLLGGCSLVTRPVAAPAPTQTPLVVIPSPPGASEAPAADPAPADPTVAPVAAGSPRGLARQIRSAERAIRNRAVTGNALAVAGHLQQVAYRALAGLPRWDARVYRRLPPDLRDVARANVYAQRELSSLSSGPPPKTLPEWRIIAPRPRAELRGYYRKAQRRYGVKWYYLAAIHLVETRTGRIRGTSTAGAKGPMQFIPSTWASYGRGDIWDSHDAIMAAGRYLRSRGAPRDMARALFSYNNDVRYVRAVSAYAHVMRADARAHRGYYHWQVYYRQRGGAVWLPVGYDGRG